MRFELYSVGTDVSSESQINLDCDAGGVLYYSICASFALNTWTYGLSRYVSATYYCLST